MAVRMSSIGTLPVDQSPSRLAAATDVAEGAFAAALGEGADEADPFPSVALAALSPQPAIANIAVSRASAMAVLRSGDTERLSGSGTVTHGSRGERRMGSTAGPAYARSTSGNGWLGVRFALWRLADVN